MPRRAPLTADPQPEPRKGQGLGTRAVHPPQVAQQHGDPVAPLLDLSSTYAFEDADTFADASRRKVGAGYVYTRWANPTVDAFEAAVADLEGAPAAEAFATGMAAISCTLLALVAPGDRIVAARQLYGGTHSLFTSVLRHYGIGVDLVDVRDNTAIEDRLAGAAAFYCETIGNPRLVVADLPRLAEQTRAHGVPLVVDNTFASPVLCRPLEHGATIVLHSATKFLGGHHDLMGGIACADERTIDRVRALARDLGPTLAPFNAWLALRGLQTLHLRVERSSASALVIARALEGLPDVDAVYYPGLPGDADHALAATLLKGQGGGTLAFDVAGGRERVKRFQDSLRLVARAGSLGGSHSLIVHAASVTHTQLSDEELEAAGISEGFCRLSVGLEDVDDLIGDLEQALVASA